MPLFPLGGIQFHDLCRKTRGIRQSETTKHLISLQHQRRKMNFNNRFCLKVVLIAVLLCLVQPLPRSRLRSDGKPGYRARSSRSPSNVHCGGTLRGASGEISSPNFPGNYPDEIECRWKIIGEPGSRITLTFKDFKVETSHACEYDSLEVYNGERKVDSERIAKLCGLTIPQVVVSRDSSLFLRFHSDFSVNFEGFRLDFTQSGCSHRYTGLTGTITSPNHPNVYPLSIDCTYNIEVPAGKRIYLSFSQFEVEVEEDSVGCVYDYVQIFDGSSAADRSLGRLCGKRLPAPVRSTSNTMTLKFSADQSISHSGFQAQYRAETPGVLDPCRTNNGGCNHVCTRRGQARHCSCYPGYVLAFDEETCTDMDECQVNNGGCKSQCVNTPGSFHCNCGEGYTPSKDNTTCVNINECATNQHKCEQRCRDTEGSYYCECHQGYQLDTDGYSCIDINECKMPESFHHCNQICVNTPGSYYCKCGPGFVLSANGRICRDQDECMMGGVQCDQTCINTAGSYFCACFPGFRPSTRLPNKCVDVDECQEGLPDCHKCFNTEGSYHCQCDKGYVQADNRTRCKDIDECMTNNGGCSQLCVNTAGGYHCKCEAGYNATDPQSRKCTDINECESHDGKGDCDHMCKNTAGSFQCSCHAGYVLAEDGLTCQDIDECASNNGGCRHKCVNTPGNYSCACHDGFLSLGRDETDFICKDIDECSTGIHECDSGSTCVNTQGNYTCTCSKGYYANFHDCLDTDECKLGLNDCQQLCNNTEGSFYCQCLPGYTLDRNGKTCSDIDECRQGMCEKECINIQGSYLCMCPDGYELADDKRHCRDINECAVNNGDCDQMCVNTNGSNYCLCKKGYELLGNQKTCRDLDECALNTACCNQGCFNTEGGYNCTCSQGYALASRCTCTDIDECAVRNGGCQQICTNKPGRYGCSCSPGFLVDSLDPTRCLDIDECKTGNGGCQHNCTNTIGTYQCTCHPKFKLQADGKSCGHCPTCDDFESLLETVQILKKQVASLEAWRQSTHRGCVDEDFEFHPEDSSWKKATCIICSCEKGKVMCEPIMGCKANSGTAPSRTEKARVEPTVQHSGLRTTPPPSEGTTDDDDDDDIGSASIPTVNPVHTVTNINTKKRDDDLFTINKRRLQQ